MKFGVITFPGSNCDRDFIMALRQRPGATVVSLWHKETDLQGCDFIILPGGFSYGDYLRSGAIARFAPIMKEVVRFAKRGGYVLGVCNGFQILTEAELLPGALLLNTSGLFICERTFIKPTTKESLLTQTLDISKAYQIPIAHAEGNYYCDEATRQSLWENGQVLFQYCTPDGGVVSEANPNGSIDNIAGICNAQKNVFGLMPHPERTAVSLFPNHDGAEILNAILARELSKN